MASMIRTNTFLKYARIHLQDAEAALQDELLPKTVERCADMAQALLKALATFLPGVRQDFDAMDEKTLTRVLGDVMPSKAEAKDTAHNLMALRRLATSPEALSRSDAEAAFSMAGQTFRAIHDLCVG